MFAISLPSYLAILKTASPEDHPYVDIEGAEEVGAAFANMAHAIAAFVEACRDHEGIGYAEARTTLEDLTHTFPETDHEDLFDVLARLMAEAKEG